MMYTEHNVHVAVVLRGVTVTVAVYSYVRLSPIGLSLPINRRWFP
jgi:hypothetical protein